jgi:thiamine kinase-like enzyme
MPYKEYIRLGVFTIDEVLNNVGPFNREYLGKKIKMGSHRYELFKTKGVVCVECGLKGEFFALEKQKQPNLINGKELPDNDKYHFNLYGYNENGEEVMLTKDHIIPKSKGGKNNLENYQTMCSVCNWNKGDTYEENESEEN